MQAGQAGQAGPSELGMSYKDTADTLASFLEIVIHTILCLRAVYPASTFTRRRAHGVAVYQSRHPAVRAYIARVVGAVSRELENARARRVSVVTKAVDTGVPLERFIIDFGYMPLEGVDTSARIANAPTPDRLSLMLRAFLIRLMALDGQLSDSPESTFAVIVETTDDAPSDQDAWVPALAADTLSPLEGHHEPLLSVRAVETGVIDLRMMVQECIGKTGVEHASPHTH